MLQNIFIVMVSMAVVAGCTSGKPRGLGMQDGKLLPCPSTPNCVSSQSRNSTHFVSPLRFEGTAAEAKKGLISVVTSMKRTRMVSEKKNYLHMEYRSAFFRFVDDVEFLIDNKNKLIHIRSASRVGYSDLGVNRRRAEKIRKRFNEFR
jgi:uncharacterized protein (DUF1499 family)